MALIAPQVTTADAPLNLTTQSAAGGGDSFLTTGREIFVIVNGGADMTVTFAHQNVCNQGFSHDSAQLVPSGDQLYLGPFDRFRFGDANGRVQVTYSRASSVDVAVTRSA